MSNGDFKWAFMSQFGMNMWGDIVTPPQRDGIQTKLLSDEEFAIIKVCYSPCGSRRMHRTDGFWGRPPG